MRDLMIRTPGSTGRKRRYLMRAIAANYPGRILRQNEHMEPDAIQAMWGWAPEQQALVKNHAGPSLIFDYGYFCGGRKEHHFCRVGICSPFPPDLPPAGADRFARLAIDVESLGDPAGPFIIVGMGRKARQSWGLAGMRWEAKTAREIRKRWPGRPIYYRPKRDGIEHIPGCENIPRAVPIREAIKGAALVLCQHSNVGVDCARYGVAASCQGGAARYFSPETLEIKIPPLIKRRQFCERLAWWQWHITEIQNGDCWPWLLEQIENCSI